MRHRSIITLGFGRVTGRTAGIEAGAHATAFRWIPPAPGVAVLEYEENPDR